MIEEVEMTAQYKSWADEACQMFGGLDICTVDVIHDEKTDKEYILEVNGTSSGLLPDHADEDNGFIRDVVLAKINRVVERKYIIVAAYSTCTTYSLQRERLHQYYRSNFFCSKFGEFQILG